MPIIVAAESKERTVFAPLVGWNPSGGMDVCVCLFHVVLLSV
jgi:hypothetical protein